MRIPINLATDPPENLRLLRTGVLLLGLAALLFGFVIVRRESISRGADRLLIERQDQMGQRLRTLQGQQSALEADISTPQAMQIRERSAFLNSLILRKSLSWTQIFMDLEQTVPVKAHIVSIRPKLNSSEDIDLTLTVAAGTMEPLVDFVKKLESSAQFGSPVLGGTHYGDTKGNGEITMDLTTRYRQDRGALAAASAAPATAPNQTSPANPANGPSASTAREQDRGQQAKAKPALGEGVTR